MANLSYSDQYTLSQNPDWQQRVKQAAASTAFDLLQESHAGQPYAEALRRQTLAQEVIQQPERHTERIAAILATQVPEELVTVTDGEVTENLITDAQLGGFLVLHWSTLAAVASDLPDMD